MRKVTYGAAVSLDLYLAGPDEALDWLRWSDDARAISGASWQGVDTILMGRKAYEFAARSGGGGEAGGITSYIFSRTMAAAPAGATLVREDAVDFVRALKAQPGGDMIVLGGGELGAALIAGGVVDEIGFNVHPLLLGGGTPALPPAGVRVALELVEARAIDKGCLFVRYRPAG